MADYGLIIRCTEGEAAKLADEIKKLGHSVRINYHLGKRYTDEAEYPANWLLAHLIVRGFYDEQELAYFVVSFGIKQSGRAKFLYELGEGALAR